MLTLPAGAGGCDGDSLCVVIWEWDLLSREDLQDYLSKISIWKRFIDDVFFIWLGSLKDLMCFLESLTSNYYNLKFTMPSHQETINFLDIQIYKNEDRSLGSSLYQKPSSGSTILNQILMQRVPILQAYLTVNICI